MNGEALTADQIGEIARLPAKDVLYGQVVGMIASPITGLVRGLNALIAGLAIQLKQIADQGLVGGEAEPASEGDAGAEAASDDDPAEAEQAAQADQAEEEAAQSAEGEETESSSEESAPAGDEAAGEETNESETPSEGDEKE
jgi:large subunit ribosomal protein L10